MNQPKFPTRLARIVIATTYLSTITTASTVFADVTSVAPAPAGLSRLKRPLKLPGKIKVENVNPGLPLEAQFRGAWSKLHDNASLDRNFRITVSKGGITTVLKSPQEVKHWMDQIKAAGQPISAYKVSGSQEVKLVIQREYGALALRDLDAQVDYNLARYHDLITSKNALNSRIVDYNAMLNDDLLAKMDQMMSQIDAMIDQMFDGATDQIMGWDDVIAVAAGIALVGTVAYGAYLVNKAEKAPLTKNEGTGLKRQGLHAGTSIPAQPDPRNTKIRYCPFCQSGYLAEESAPMAKLVKAFNAYHTDLLLSIDTHFRNLPVR